MPDRNLRERDRALTQRLERLQQQVRDLTLRAWAGALRTTKAASATPTTYSGYVQALSLVVPSGRWEVHADVTFTVAAATGEEDFYLAIDLLDPTTGAVTGNAPISPRRIAPAATPGAFLSLPVTLIDDFSAEGDVTVSLKTRNAGETVYSLGTPRLLVLPV